MFLELFIKKKLDWRGEMNLLAKKLHDENKVYHFWTTSDTVLLAVSGGVDSMALLDAFSKIPIEERPNFAVLHVHHHLRKEADVDCKLVQQFCMTQNIPFYVQHWDKELHPDSNLEAAARNFRYQFFDDKMNEFTAAVLLTAHHADDQMETILMRLTRGSTLNGVAGIKKERLFGSGKLVRPLLDVQKDELYEYCKKYQVPYIEDATNAGEEFTRNRFRNQITPLIKKENTKAAQHFNEFSVELQALLEVAKPIIKKAFRNCFKQKDDIWFLEIPLFLTLTHGMRYLLLSYFLQEVWLQSGTSFRKSHVDDILELIEGVTPQATLNVSGGKVERRYEVLYFKKNALSKHGKDTDEKNFQTYLAEIELNQWLELPFNGKIGLFLYSEPNVSHPSLLGTHWVRVEEGVPYPLHVRYWQAGDRIRMNKNAPFTKKVSRIFIDRKIPQEKRAQAIVVTDAEDRILWIPGFAHSIWVSKGNGIMEVQNKDTREQQKMIVHKNYNEVTE